MTCVNELEIKLGSYFERMSSYFGPTNWWPGDSSFEIAVGAILTQNTAWSSVEKAITNLRREDLLSPQRILDCSEERLESALRPSGYFKVKARRLRSFCSHLRAHYEGSMDRLALQPVAALRKELLLIHGIGPETADDIILYACNAPVFVVDAYTKRILGRHGLVSEDVGYDELQALLEGHVERDLHRYKEYHGLLVMTAKEFCKTSPSCAGCPLEPMLKKGQPILSPGGKRATVE